MTTNLPTDFSDAAENTTPPVSNPAPPVESQDQKDSPESAKDLDGIPYCVDHHCRMVRVSGGKKGAPLSYYKCPVPKCGCTAQVIRTKRESVVPSEPITCPHCSTRAKKKPICIRNKELSSHGGVVLQCPECGWRTNKLPDARLAAMQLDHRDRLRAQKKD